MTKFSLACPKYLQDVLLLDDNLVENYKEFMKHSVRGRRCVKALLYSYISFI